jgi:hypothetical protein
MTANFRFHFVAAIFTLLMMSLGGCHDTGGKSAAGAATIGGTPAGSAMVGVAYEFHPSISAAAGANLSFTITNQPRWTKFDPSTGQLFGSPAAADVGVYSSISIAANDGAVSSAIGPFSIEVLPSPSASELTISGIPETTVAAGAYYSFHPTVSAPSGAKLTYVVANKPAWAQFDTSTAILSGTPAAPDVGTYAQIIITVNDPAGSASLAPFSIAVTPPSAVAATITWSAPVDPSSQVAGYHIYYGASAAEMSNVVEVNDPTATRYVIDSLASGVWYFAMVSYDASQAESVRSATVSVTL